MLDALRRSDVYEVASLLHNALEPVTTRLHPGGGRASGTAAPGGRVGRDHVRQRSQRVRLGTRRRPCRGHRRPHGPLGTVHRRLQLHRKRQSHYGKGATLVTTDDAQDYSPVAALVMAGAPNDGPLKDADPAPYEALIRIGGRPMIEYVLEVLRAAPSVGPVGIVGPTAELKAAVRLEDELLIEPGRGMLDNLERGARELRAAGHTGHLLVVTSDIPLVSVEAVESFLSRCRARRVRPCPKTARALTPTTPWYGGKPVKLASPACGARTSACGTVSSRAATSCC